MTGWVHACVVGGHSPSWGLWQAVHMATSMYEGILFPTSCQQIVMSAFEFLFILW